MKIRPKIIRVHVNRLLLDVENPRLPEHVGTNKDKIWKHMKNAYDLDELALSMAENGYFEAEPLVVIPADKSFKDNEVEAYENYRKSKETKFIVAEGNRRLATIQGLINGELNYPISDEINKQFEDLPVLFYPNRESVLAFLGVHHLAGVRKWNLYERARYIIKLKNKGWSIDDIQKKIGDRKNSAKKTYVCHRLIEILKEYDESFNIKDAKKNFSFLLLATGQEAIRKYIGLPTWSELKKIDEPIPNDKKDNLKFLFECLFDNGNKKSLIQESRDITNKLSRIFGDANAAKILQESNSIENAFEMIGGELIGLSKLSGDVKKKLETISGKLSGMDIEEILRSKKGKELSEISTKNHRISENIVKRFTQ